MANYNLAHGGDIHYNPNYDLYPQNAYVNGRPEFGSSTTALKPAHHWEGGNYAAVRHISFGDEAHQIGAQKIGRLLEAGDTFLSHIVPSGSLLTDFHYRVHGGLEGASFTLRLASDQSVIGTVDGSVTGDGWFQLATPVYVPDTANDGIEWVLDAWPDTTPAATDVDPCGVFGPCEEEVKFCFTSTVFYKNHRSEQYCEDTCWD